MLLPLPFAMCFSAAEERPGGILALPNGFLKTLVATRYGDELVRYAESVGLERVGSSSIRRSRFAPLTRKLLTRKLLTCRVWRVPRVCGSNLRG